MLLLFGVPAWSCEDSCVEKLIVRAENLVVLKLMSHHMQELPLLCNFQASLSHPNVF